MSGRTHAEVIDIRTGVHFTPDFAAGQRSLQGDGALGCHGRSSNPLNSVQQEAWGQSQLAGLDARIKSHGVVPFLETLSAKKKPR
jgi:hypothetical protein